MEEKLRNITHSTNKNYAFQRDDFSYSDKRIVSNKYGSPIVKIDEFRPSKPPKKSFQELHFDQRILTQRSQLEKKIMLSTEGLSPLRKKKPAEESLLSPLFKQPREPDQIGLAELCSVETPYGYNRNQVFSDKMKKNANIVKKGFQIRLSNLNDFEKVASSFFLLSIHLPFLFGSN